MKKGYIYIISALLVMCFTGAHAQNVVLNAKIDTFQMLIGEQTTIRLELSVDAGNRVKMPEFKTGSVNGLEVLDTKADVRSINEGKREVYTNEYLITTFDSTLYSIPPFEVLVNDSAFRSNPLALAVYSVPIDTANLQNICGPKAIQDVELTWEEYRDSVYLGVILAILGAVLAWVVTRLVKNKPIIRIIKIKPKLPSHITALNRIEEIKGDKSLRLEGNTKEYYTQLTDTLREYMRDRYGFNATEMTTSEIVGHLLKIQDKESIKDLKEILQVADLVKFAKLHPSINENDRNMANAIEFVNETKNIEEEKVQQPTEKRIVNQRSLFEKRMLIVSISVIACVLVVIAALLAIDMYNLFS
jgi:hypothetical protein